MRRNQQGGIGALGNSWLLFQSLSDYIFNILKLISKDEGMEKCLPQGWAPLWAGSPGTVSARGAPGHGQESRWVGPEGLEMGCTRPQGFIPSQELPLQGCPLLGNEASPREAKGTQARGVLTPRGGKSSMARRVRV